MQSTNSQRSSESSDDSPRPDPKTQQQIQQEPMTNMRQLPLGMNPEDIYVSPYWVLAVFSIMGMLLIAFIAGVVSLLSIDAAQSSRHPVATKNATSELLSIPPQIAEPIKTLPRSKIDGDQQLNILTGQKNLLSQLLKTNTKNEPIDIFFAKYLLQNAQKLSNKSSTQYKHEIEYYTKIYGDYITAQQKQLPICIIATGRNNMQQQRQQRFLKSVQRLSYTNFQLIYVDDASSDETPGYTKRYLQQSPHLKDRSVVIEQKQRMYALSNKVKAISLCRDQDIIVDVDADDSFIGAQVLRVLNHIYKSNPNLWMVYTNHLVNKQGNITKGKNRGLSDQEFLNYRVLENVWVSSHLKTFRKELFSKINTLQWKKQDGSFYDWASDRFIMYALFQLAGPQHSQFQNIIPYQYDYAAASQQIRNFQIIKLDKLRSQSLTPYVPLKSLKDKVKKLQNYQIPKILIEHIRRAKEKNQALSKEPSIKN